MSSSNHYVSSSASSKHTRNNNSSLLMCSFNQDGDRLAIGTMTGFSMHNLHPEYSLSVKHELQGGIAHVKMRDESM